MIGALRGQVVSIALVRSTFRLHSHHLANALLLPPFCSPIAYRFNHTLYLFLSPVELPI